jgi:hypothetical protein
LVGLAVLFLACGAVLMVTEDRGANAITLPVALLASDLLIAATLVSRWHLVRPIAQGLAIFGTLVHLLVLIRNGPVWTRACAGLLVVAHVQALVLLFQLSIRERTEDDTAEGDGAATVVDEVGSDPPVVIPAQRTGDSEMPAEPVADQEEPAQPVRSETETEEPEGTGGPASEQDDQAAENEERAS